MYKFALIGAAVIATCLKAASAQSIPSVTGAAHLFSSPLPGVVATDLCIAGTPVSCQVGSLPDIFAGVGWGAVKIDPVGSIYLNDVTPHDIAPCRSDNFNVPMHAWDLLRTSSTGGLEPIGSFSDNCSPGDGRPFREQVTLLGVVAMDSVNGTLYVKVGRTNEPGCCYGGSPVPVYGKISGLANLMDVLLTFVPGGQALQVVTPTHPDGFRSADSFQVWTGSVRSMPDWSQAEPLTCEAAVNPAPGQVVNVPDVLPDPAIGEGRYYLVASQSGADRRLGRQYVNGAFSARIPTSLSPCM